VKTRALGLLSIGVVLALGGCGSHAVEPTVTVKAGPTFQFQDRLVRTFDLLPKGSPSGVVALKTVYDGSVKTLGSIRFTKLSGPGSVAVETSPRDIDVAWNVPTEQGSLTDRPVPWAAHSLDGGATAWGADQAIGNVGYGMNQETDFWIVARYYVSVPSEGSDVVGDFAFVVSESKQTPRKINYCLTLKVDAVPVSP
jgi:hypothetical protein